jgi:hypothetical protein
MSTAGRIATSWRYGGQVDPSGRASAGVLEFMPEAAKVLALRIKKYAVCSTWLFTGLEARPPLGLFGKDTVMTPRGYHYMMLISSATLLLGGCAGDDSSGGGSDTESSTATSKSETKAAGQSNGDSKSASSTATGAASTISDDPEKIVVTGPITSGKGTPFRSAAVYAEKAFGDAGYVEEEFFYEGGAVSYVVDGQMSKDGKWAVKEEAKAPFRTRLLVRRPKDAAKFNGTVVVEWLNVSAGADGDPGFMYNFKEILREGYGYVGVSAQQVGVQGGGFSLGGGGAGRTPLKDADAERYGSLAHPGDGYSFDIFTRAAKVVRGAGGKDILGGLKPKHLLAYGESQSAGRMVSYVNAFAPKDKAFDGYFIHSRGASGTPLGNGGGGLALGAGFGGGGASLIRDDLDAPVFQFQTETDVFGMFGFTAARQPNTPKIVTWEVAGTAHADQYLLDFGDGMEGAVMCENANDGPQWYVLRAALHALNAWVVDGTMPPQPTPIEADSSGSSAKLDGNGNAIGGVRSPAVDVPVSVLSGLPGNGGNDFFCFLFGHTTPFTADKLKQLYPTHDDYVSKFKEAAKKAREGLYLLGPEEEEILATAQAAKIPE